MNNCQKCGNPVQIGIDSCPICGTNISVNSVSSLQPNQNTVSVQSEIQPDGQEQSIQQIEQNEVQEQPVQQIEQTEVQEQPVSLPSIPVVQTSTNEQATSQVIANAPIQEIQAAPTPVPAVSTTNVVQQEPVNNNDVQISKVVETQSIVNETNQPINNQNIIPTPTTQPQQNMPAQTVTNDVNNIAPIVNKVVSPTPVPSVPGNIAPIPINTVVSAPNTEQVNVKPKKNNKTILVLGVIILVALVCVGAYTMFLAPKTTLTPNKTNGETASLTTLSSNGYKLKLKDGWINIEDGTNVIITNESETVAIKLDRLNNNFNELNKDKIISYFSTQTGFSNIEATETQISAKKSFLVSCMVNQMPVQYYYINGGTNLIIVTTIAYQSNDSKTKYEADVTEMISTLSYSDDSIKALNTMQMYSNIFGNYNGIFTYDQNQMNNSPVENQTPYNENSNNNQQIFDENINNESNDQSVVE